MTKGEILKAAYLGSDRFFPEDTLDQFLKDNGFQSPVIPSERLAKAIMVYIQLEKSAKIYPNCSDKKTNDE